LKICIDIPGNTSNGLWSAERGESRWAQNWASLLASQGHEITCVCTPGLWGECPPIPNVTLVTRPDTNKMYDVFMHACWWEGRDIFGVKSRVYVHHHYGFSDWLKKESFIGRNHVISYPYLQTGYNFIGDHNPWTSKTFALPIPLASKFGESHFDKKNITFSAKDVFLDRYFPSHTDWFRCGKIVIETMKKLNAEFGYKCHFLMWEQLGSGNKYVEVYGVDKIIESIPDRMQYPSMPSRRVLDLLDVTKMSFPIISCGGSQIESAMMGILPLTWEGSPFDIPARKYDWILTDKSTEEQIVANIYRSITDRKFNDELLALYQKELEAHLYESSLSYFKRLTDWMEKNT
jgi:hypothetical protein